ncbi:MAG: hypothetical protein WC824_02570 [Bacteroidota bacterium]
MNAAGGFLAKENSSPTTDVSKNEWETGERLESVQFYPDNANAQSHYTGGLGKRILPGIFSGD